MNNLSIPSIKLAEGVNIHPLHTDKFKTNLISVYFRIPLRRETATLAALLPSVLKRGTEKYPTMAQLSARAEELYGASLSAGIAKKGDSEVIRFSVRYVSCDFLPENITGGILELLSQLVLCPKLTNGAFDAEYLAQEKENTKSSIEGLINDKKAYAQARCNEIMFEGDPYGVSEYGYIDELEKITPQSLFEFYKSLLDTAAVEIFVSGSFDEETVVKRIAAEFSRLGARTPKLPATRLAEREADICVKDVTEPMPVTQSKLCIGYNCGISPRSAEYADLRLFCAIFGGSPFSKLFNNVREKLSLAYYVFSVIEGHKSCMKISSGIEADKFRAAYDEINVQLEKMKAGDFTDDEIESAKKYLATGFGSIKDSLDATENFYLDRLILGSGDSIDEYLERLCRVERDGIIRAANSVQLDTIYFLKGEGSDAVQ